MRRAGLRGIRARQRLEERSGDRGEKLLSEQMAHVEKQLAAFKGHLEDFSKQYRDEIKKDPVFRAQFATMCAKIGVDPLSSGKGFWGELLVRSEVGYKPSSPHDLSFAWVSLQLHVQT